MKKFNSSAKVNVSDVFGDVNYDKISVAYGVVDMTTETGDYRVDSPGIPAEFIPKHFYLIPETTGDIVVELAGMDEGVTYTISSAQVSVNLGLQLKYKIRRVLKSGTTATFSVVW